MFVLRRKLIYGKTDEKSWYEFVMHNFVYSTDIKREGNLKENDDIKGILRVSGHKRFVLVILLFDKVNNCFDC